MILCAPVYAEPEVQNTSAPSSSASGTVNNQAIQFQNNGAPSRQFFRPGNSCNGATMTFSPFYMGNDTIPYEAEGYVRNNNYGAQLNFMVPLDRAMIQQCKDIARRHEQRMRLDYELLRATKCAELQRLSFTFRPGSKFVSLCSDIIPIVKPKDDRASSDRVPDVPVLDATKASN